MAGAGARSGRGAGPQRIGAHHDPLAVGREHQQIPGLRGRRAPGRIEVLKVHRGEPSELFDLAFSQPLPGLATDRIDRVIEAAARGLQRGELAQPVRMTLDRQVERRVGGMQVPHPGCPVGQPLDRHGAEHGLQSADVTRLDPPAEDTLIAPDILKALLA